MDHDTTGVLLLVVVSLLGSVYILFLKPRVDAFLSNMWHTAKPVVGRIAVVGAFGLGTGLGLAVGASLLFSVAKVRIERGNRSVECLYRVNRVTGRMMLLTPQHEDCRLQ